MADKLQNSDDNSGLLPPGTTTYNNYYSGIQFGHTGTFAGCGCSDMGVRAAYDR
jgi:hypothetical protein